MGGASFLYDRVSRLTSGTLYLEPAADVTARTQSYTFDSAGNLQSITTNGSTLNTPTSGSTNRLTSGTYDFSGNLTNWSGNTYEYGPFDDLWHYRTAAGLEYIYLYTADDERVWAFQVGLNNSLWTLRDLDAKVLRQYRNNDGAWSIEEDDIYRDRLLLAAETPAGVRHFHLDHLGTPRLVTDRFGQQAAYHVYYPFGQEATAISQDVMRLKFTGHERDLADSTSSQDDLDYMHARHESPLLGRFLSVDVKAPHNAISIPQKWNRYSYTRGNPLKLIDPDGLQETAPRLPEDFGLGAFFTAVKNFFKGQGFNSRPDVVYMDGHTKELSVNRSIDSSLKIALASGAAIAIGEKIARQMTKRGWTEEKIKDVIENPARTQQGTDRTRNDEPATLYFDKNGAYVAVNDKTGDVVQVSDANDPDWKVPPEGASQPQEPKQ